jgi:hypothetical protein
LEQTVPFFSAFDVDLEERAYIALLDQLSLKKISWQSFLSKIDDPLQLSRLSTTAGQRTLLHLAVLDNELDVVAQLKKDPSLKLRLDHYGLSPLEMAQFLNRKEALYLLKPSVEAPPFPNLPQLDSFEYLSHPIFETKEGLEKTLLDVAKAKQGDKIQAEKIWMGIYFDKEIRKGVHPPVSVRLVNEKVGHGVFADKKIPPCTFVGEYTGIIQERTPRQLKDKKHCLRYTIWEGEKNFAIDAEKKGNFTRFINHSEKPNLGLQSVYWRGIPRMIFISLKEIRENGQLTFDYGPLFWKNIKEKPVDFDDLV